MPARIVTMLPAAPPDPRRTITEAQLSTETGFGIARFTRLDVHPTLGEGPAVLGRHFHREDRERFIVVDGYGVLVTQEVDPKTEQLTGERKVELVRAGDVIVMEPYTAHTFVFDLPTLMLCASTHPFDKLDMPAAEPELPSVGQRAMISLAAETGDKGEAFRAEEIFFTTPSGVKIEFVIDLPTVILSRNGRHEHVNITEQNLGEVLLQVRAA